MNAMLVAQRPPSQPRAIVLEDDVKTAEELLRVLETDFSASVDLAPDMRSYHRFVDANSYEAASIDWDIRGSVAGASALNAVRHSPAGCIVYTNYPTFRDEAIRYGANEVVEKHHIVEYAAAFDRAVRYGFAREIMMRMPTVRKVEYPVPAEEEAGMCLTALNEAVRMRGAGKMELVDLLKRRGWISDVSPFDLAKQPWSERIRYFAGLCESSIEQMAIILRSDPRQVEARLESRDPTSWEDPLVRSIDDLTSIFLYAFRIAGKHPELMQHYWTIQNLFTHEESAPPWNRTGIADYLASTGVDGIQCALRWIRSH